MRTVDFVVVLAIVTVLSVSSDGMAGGKQNEGEPQLKGHVFVLAQEISPPWSFTGIGEDTLRLNGVPFSPTRGRAPDISDEYFAKVRERAARRHRAKVCILEATDRYDTWEDKLAAADRAAGSSSTIDSIAVAELNILTVYLNDEQPPYQMRIAGEWYERILESTEPPPEDDSVCEDSSPPATRRELHEWKIESFWHTMNSGGLLIVLGPGSRVGCPESMVAATLKVIELLKIGEPIPDDLLKSSCFAMEIGFERFKGLVKMSE